MPNNKTLPKYVREQSGNLYYQRDYPSRLYRQTKLKTFKHPLRLKATHHTDTDLQIAISAAAQSYDTNVRLMENSDSSVFTDTDLDRAAFDLLSRMNLVNSKKAKQVVLHEALDDGLINLPHWHDIQDKWKEANHRNTGGNTVEPVLTPQEQVTWRAYKALLKQERVRPLLLSEAWQDYIKVKKLNPEIRKPDGRIIDRGNEILSYIGDHNLHSKSIAKTISTGLQEYYKKRRAEPKRYGGERTPQSVVREQKEIVSAINRASRLNHLGWQISVQNIEEKPYPQKDRVTVDLPEQIALVKHCLADTKTPWLSTIILLELQSGAMASEIARLDCDEALEQLSAKVPHIKFGRSFHTKAKSENRRRVVPIVLGRSYLIRHLPETIKWLNKSSNGDHSLASNLLKKRLVMVTGIKDVTAHCLRHTARGNAEAAALSHSHTESICGWSGGVLSKDAINYGVHRLSIDQGFKELAESSRRMHQFLIDAIDTSDSNVVQLRK